MDGLEFEASPVGNTNGILMPLINDIGDLFLLCIRHLGSASISSGKLGEESNFSVSQVAKVWLEKLSKEEGTGRSSGMDEGGTPSQRTKSCPGGEGAGPSATRDMAFAII